MKSDLQKPIVGFSGSLILTLLSYWFVTTRNDTMPISSLFIIVSGLAVAQLYIQLIFFLHLGTSRASRWNLVSFLYTSLLILFFAVGSIWIMKNLEYGHTGHSSTSRNKSPQSIIKDEIPTDHKNHLNDAQ